MAGDVHLRQRPMIRLPARLGPSKLVAVVVPLSNRPDLTSDEHYSLRHLNCYLGKYDKYMLAPNSLKVSHAGFTIKRFDDSFFGSAAANNRLMLTPGFYQAFSNYQYILIYHLDALVFSDQLVEWCNMDLDYIGPPWLPCPDTPYVTVPRVGNGGFSLRKIQGFQRVIRSRKYWVEPSQYWADLCRGKPWYVRYANLPRKLLKRLPRFNGARQEMAHWHLRNDRRNEDYFWSDEAVRYYPEFRIPSVEVARRFAFEVAPRHCFELNGRQLPFGCHAWARYDRAFWEPYLLR
jgi:hypothetical protein